MKIARVFHPNLDVQREATNCIVNGRTKRELYRFLRENGIFGLIGAHFSKERDWKGLLTLGEESTRLVNLKKFHFLT